MATRSTAVEIGKIVRSDSHVRYTCQIFGPGEHSIAPEPDDYAFGTFVRVPLRRLPARADVALESYLPAPDSDVAPRQVARRGGRGFWAVGLIYDTILLNPAFGSLGAGARWSASHYHTRCSTYCSGAWRRRRDDERRRDSRLPHLRRWSPAGW